MQKYHNEPKQYKGYLKSALDSPPNPVPLRVVNATAGNAAVLSFAATVFSLLF